jgi:glycosyltransferase involved in cell wall biosynthesis
MMKVIHIIPSYLPAKLASGPIIPTHNLNKELVKKGFEVVVYTTNLDGAKILDVPLNQEVDIDGVKIFYFPISFKPWQYSWRMHRALAKNVKNFDLIHITSVFLAASTLGAYYAKKFKKPYIISPHGSLMSDPLSRDFLKKKVYLNLIERKNLKNAVVHFLVDQEKEDYLKAGLPLKEAVIIPNGFSSEEFNAGTSDVPRGSTSQMLKEFREEVEPRKIGKNLSMSGGRTSNANVNQYLGSPTSRTPDVQKLDFRQKFGISTDKKIILFLGRLHPIKGLDTLIPAFAKIVKKEPRAVLVLVGPDENNYKKEIELEIRNWKLEISRDIVFTGMLIGEDKISALQESDVFVLPSYSENFGMAVVEAMYFGLPVVITKNVGISPSVEKAGVGIVIDKDEKQLAEAILKILNNPQLGKEMGEKGKKLVETEFSAGKVAERWIEEYSELAN